MGRGRLNSEDDLPTFQLNEIYQTAEMRDVN